MKQGIFNILIGIECRKIGKLNCHLMRIMSLSEWKS